MQKTKAAQAAAAAEELQKNPPTQAQIDEKNNKASNALIISLSVIGGIILLAIITGGAIWLFKRHKKQNGSAPGTTASITPTTKNWFHPKEAATKMKSKFKWKQS